MIALFSSYTGTELRLNCTVPMLAPQVHKRFDPIYVDAKDRIEALGNFSYMYAYMSQPKHQLDTFRAWAGKGSDIRCRNNAFVTVIPS